MAQIRLHIAGSISCLSAACFIVSNEVLLKAPSISRNAPRAKSLGSIAFSMHVTTFYSAVSVIYLFGKHVGFGVKDTSSVHCPQYISPVNSPSFPTGKKTGYNDRRRLSLGIISFPRLRNKCHFNILGKNQN
jgi:hypothetical protein